MDGAHRAAWWRYAVIGACLLWATPVWAGVPTNAPIITDPMLDKFLKSLLDHLNTLECITTDPDGSILGTRGELKCALFNGFEHICMNTSTGPAKGTTWLCTSLEPERQAVIVITSPTDADNFLFIRPEQEITVSQIDCIVEDATSAVITVQECDGNGNSCTAVETAITCAVTNTTHSGSIDNAVVDAGDWMRVDVGAVVGTPGHVAVSVTYRGPNK